MFENVTVIDKLAELRERDVEDDWGRDTLASAPLLDGADAVLGLHDLVRNSGCGDGDPEPEICLRGFRRP